MEKKWITAFKVKITVLLKVSVFVQIISSKPLNILLPNLILGCHTVSWSACEKLGFAFFKFKVIARAHSIKI